nr:reverse transcriptase domain-containing protein [Tanacetum cinerariifolium]
QILADFIVELLENDPQDTAMGDEEALSDPWILFTDGSSCIDGSEAGLVITNPEGMEFTYALRFRFGATNNEAKYEALIFGLRIAEQMGIKNLQVNVDSRLVANQVNGTYIAKEPGMIKYLEKVNALTSTFKELSIKQVPRGENKKADALSKIASTSFAHLSKQKKSYKKKRKKQGLYVARQRGAQIKKFVWDNIVCRFNSPGEIIWTNHSKICAKSYASANALLPSNIHKPMTWWKGQTLAGENFTCPMGTLDWHANFENCGGRHDKNDEALGINLDLLEEKESRQQSKKQKAKPRWENTIILGFVAQVSGRETLSTETTKQSMRKKEASSDLSGKDHIKDWHANFENCGGRHDKNDEALGINLDLLEEKESRQQSKKQKAKPRWENTIILGFVAQVSGRETLSTETTKQSMRKKEASSDLSGKDHIKS